VPKLDACSDLQKTELKSWLRKMCNYVTIGVLGITLHVTFIYNMGAEGYSSYCTFVCFQFQFLRN
jgi:hypothetical protein